MIAPLVLAGLAGLASGALLPGPAEDGADFRYASVRCSLTPAAVKPGEEARLTVRIIPRAGARWYDAELVPAKVEIMPAKGWVAEPSEIELPEAETPEGPREFSVRLRMPVRQTGAGEEFSGAKVLELRVRYGVRLSRSPEDADAPGVVFEEGKLTVEVPTALPAEALPVVGDGEGNGEREGAADPSAPSGAFPALEGAGAGRPVVVTVERERGSPVLPALFFALASALVFVGLAAWLRRSRGRE